MNFSTNFKVALISIFVVGLVLLSSVLYATQLVSVEGVKTQMGIYQQALEAQVHNLSSRMATLEKNVVTGDLLNTISTTTNKTDSTSIPVDTSELLPGGTSYLVCKSVDNGSVIYTTTLPYPPFSGPVYDSKGNLLKSAQKTTGCIRTTKAYFDSNVKK